jgi:hypothetical protein
MKKILCLTFSLVSTVVISSQGLTSIEQPTNYLLTSNSLNLHQDEGYPISRLALSINPLGFVEFGPLINAEVGLTKNLVLNSHIRFATLGLLSYVTADWPDRITGLAYGGGVLYFFGEKRNKPYVGILSEYQKTKDFWENSSEIDKIITFMFNGGYRFRFENGFFINTGAFFGLGYSHWVWTGSSTQEDKEFHAAGLLEVTLGFEF